MREKKGLLLINLGSPQSLSIKDVRQYLKEFLMDPRVIDLPLILRWLILHMFILPFRPKKTALAYQKIWTKEGSPLVLETKSFAQSLQKNLRENYTVSFAMRYQQPSIAHGLKTLAKENCSSVIIFPLYPQYASSSTGTALEAIFQLLSLQENIPAIKVVPVFYAKSFYIDPLSAIIQKFFKPHDKSHLLFSFHGLPERHISKGENLSQPFCPSNKPCPEMDKTRSYCYRSQCFATARKVASKLNLKEDQYTVSFQSRLGVTPWIKPYSREVLHELRRHGIQDLYIVCPSFVADCLETLEEAGMQFKELWIELGGREFTLIPCLNSDDLWVNETAKYISENF